MNRYRVGLVNWASGNTLRPPSWDDLSLPVNGVAVKRVWLILLVLCTLAAGALAGQRWVSARSSPDEPAAHPAGVFTGVSVTALGRLEPEGGVISVGGQTGERVGQLLVREGQQVRAGEELAHFSARPLYQAELRQAEAALAQLKLQAQAFEAHADAQIAEAELAVRLSGEPQKQEIQAQTAQIELLKANLESASKDRSRLVSLGRDIVSAQQLDHQVLLEKRAVQDLETAQHQLRRLQTATAATLEQAKAQLATARTAKEQGRVAIGIEAAQRAVETARIRYELATLRAPRAGQIFKLLIHEGETITGPILLLGDTGRFLVRAEVFETEVLHVQVGQKVQVTSKALSGDLNGQVEAVLWTVARNNVRTLDPLSASDVRVVEVLVRIDDAQVEAGRETLSRLIGLQVDVRIETPGRGKQ